jgi:hypothetical protein
MPVRTFVFTGLLLVVAASLAAQHVVPEVHDFVSFNHGVAVHSFQAPAEQLDKAKAALNLNDVQVTAISALLKMRAETTHQVLQDVEAAQRKLHEMAGQTNANATEIGTAFLAVQTAHERMVAAGKKFRTDFEALLNAEQRSLLARLNAASQQIEALRHLELLEGGSMEMALPFHKFGSIEMAEPGVRVKRIVVGNQ